LSPTTCDNSPQESTTTAGRTSSDPAIALSSAVAIAVVSVWVLVNTTLPLWM
jgi:hypothetical protein